LTNLQAIEARYIMRYWIKLYTEILSDPKMGRLSDRQFRTCINLFALAGEIDKDGELPSVSDMAWHLRRSEDDLTADLEALVKVGIVDRDGDTWLVRKWQERQAKAPSAAREKVLERVHDYRERKRNEQGATRNESVTTLQHDVKRGVTPPEKNREDIDKEKINDDNAGGAVDNFSGAIAGAVRAYENAIGVIAGAEQANEIADMIEQLERKHLLFWWSSALKIACDNNARSWSYVRAIITNSLATGKAPGTDKPSRNGKSGRAKPDNDVKRNGYNVDAIPEDLRHLIKS
jgi:hypothetical protein